ncbi:MAG: hypothetical protein IBX72_15280 [Nitrospirae bacterium]|nr:hypothetical protein [Nitrospirota bacterium]
MWYAIYTKRGKEDSVTERLQDIGINVLNPKLKLRKFKRSRLVDVIEPLFPCYLFAAFEKARYTHLITYTRGVRYIVGKNNPVSVHDDVINTIKENMDEDNLTVINPGQFLKGERVLIKDGPFKDMNGGSLSF